MTPKTLMHTQRLYARRLRRAQTESEKLLWEALRRRRCAGLKFRRQHPFGPFILDFYCADHRLAVELDGGGHGEKRAAEHDRRRSRWLACQGVRELRFWNTDVIDNLDGLLVTICAAVSEAPSPGPAMPARPLPRGEAE